MRPAVEVRGIHRRFGDVVALDGVSLSVGAGEFFSLLGPSGCGKTTLLRMVAGLDHPDAGDLLLGGESALGIPPYRRSVNTVFQSYALFPHLNVFDNVAFGLRMKRVSPREADRRIEGVLELTRIEDLARRWPAQLSGGQRQRVALARALVNEPQVLLLDEPLAALDLQLRRELRTELRALQRRTGVTFLLVTHDQEEALALSDRIAVMRKGRVEQAGTGEELYRCPRTRFVAEFLGACNVFDGRVKSLLGGEACVLMAWGVLRLPIDRLPAGVTLERSLAIAIRPEQVSIRADEGPWNPNEFHARLLDQVYTGAETHVVLEAAGTTVRARIANTAAFPNLPPRGTQVRVGLPMTALLALDP